MDKDERNHWIMGYMSDKGYGMDSASARRNLQNILNRDRKGKDVLGDLMNIMGEMIKEDEQSIDSEVLIQDLNEYTEMCDELKDDLLKVDQPLGFEAFLNSDLLAARRNQIKTRGVIFHTLGTVSTIASMCLVVHILRSHHGLSTTYHRLVFGLSIGDIMSSFANVLGSTMVPKEMNYYVLGAQGNMTTCTA